MTDPAVDTGRRTFVLVDGENIDATLGQILGRRPAAEERPRWERVTDYLAQWSDQPVTGLFFLDASNGHLPMSFVQALIAMGYRPVPLSGADDEKVVDIGIQRTLAALRDHDADVVLVSHDADFVPQVRDLLDGRRRVALAGFREFMSGHLTALGLPFLDLEHDVESFRTMLPRVRVIPLTEFQPEEFLR
ncbi:MAG: NYN domain-containing protein [Nocardioides sp.]|nr:NYN domain-containing protein [Nocardioides sp.]